MGLVMLSKELGNYKKISHPSYLFDDGENIEFFCPICHHNLVATDINHNLAKVLMIDENQVEFVILFSGISGEKCTYLVKGHNIESFGDDSLEYTNYFGETPNY